MSPDGDGISRAQFLDKRSQFATWRYDDHSPIITGPQSIELPKKLHLASKPPVSKSKTKGKEKEAPVPPAPTFDHEEGAVHDMVLQAQLLQGYHKFKVCR
jgi:hypothetical protein